jgi:2-methylcitrate dehydratase PrpD
MIMHENNLAYEDIREVTVRVPEGALSQINGNELLTHNMQYVLAVAAVDGRVTSDQFHHVSSDPRVSDLAKRVRVVGEPKLEASLATKRSGIVNLITTGGKEIERQVDDAIGEPANPLSRDKLEEKFVNLAGQVLPKEQVGRILESVSRLERLQDVSGLMRLCAP